MNINVSMGGIGSSARMRALVLVREAIAQRQRQQSETRGTAGTENSVQRPDDPPAERGR